MNKYRSVIVTYDISDNKIRTKAFKILKDWRIDGQKSVHECLLTNNQAMELFLQLNTPLNQNTDKLMMVWLDSHKKVLCRGLGRNNMKKFLWNKGYI